MQDFILHANIEHLHRKLAVSDDEAQRSVIIDLLSSEIAKLPMEEQEDARRRLQRVESSRS